MPSHPKHARAAPRKKVRPRARPTLRSRAVSTRLIKKKR